MKIPFLVISFLMASVAFGESLQNMTFADRGDHDGRDHYGRAVFCEDYVPFSMCTGRELYSVRVDRRTTKYECMDICNRQLREMRWHGDACCQLQHHPDFPSNCKLKDGYQRQLSDGPGDTVGSAMCTRYAPPPPPPPRRVSVCENYQPYSACTGRDLFVWTAPYVNRQTRREDCMDLCNRELRQMNWRGDACCQLQKHPDHPVSCRLRDGYITRGGDHTGASICEPGRFDR